MFLRVGLLFMPVLWSVICSRLPSGVYYLALNEDATIGYYWTVDYQQQKVQFEIHLPHRKNGQWFAIGFSDYGEFYAADYCVLSHTRELRKAELQDTWADEDGNIYEDEEQNCENFKISSNGSILKFTFERKFDTCDSKDYIIEGGTTHIVWLRGDVPVMDNVNEMQLKTTDALESGMQRTQLLKNPKVAQIKKPKNTNTIEFKANKVQVPKSDTTYWCHVHKVPSYLLNKIHHIIQFEAIIQRGNEGLVHHMEVFHCEAKADQVISDYNAPCFDEKRPKDTEVCKKVLAAWAMGATPFVYPQEAGAPIGGKNFNPYVMLEVHYNNPEEKDNWVDSSGVRLYVTSSLRKYDAGVMELGLEYIDKMAIPPRQPSFLLPSFCISECTAVALPAQGITIFGSQLHTHLTGIQVVTKHVRDGRELLELNKDNHYSTHFQEIRLLERPVLILPGDALITSCRYNSLERKNITLGGFAIKDEMCVNYVHYYPKIELEVCKSSISYQSLFSYFKYLNQWENEDTNENYGISKNYGNIKWDEKRVNELQALYMESTLSMQCNASSGQRFPGDWENVPSTKILYPFPPPIRICKEQQNND